MSNLIPLILGLIVFIGCHIVTRMQGVRAGLIAKFGEALYRTLYSLVAITGLALIVWMLRFAARATGSGEVRP